MSKKLRITQVRSQIGQTQQHRGTLRALGLGKIGRTVEHTDSRELAGSTLQGGGSVEGEWVVSGQSWKLDSDTRFGNAGLQSRMNTALALFNRSDCVIHAIDIGGLRAASDPSGSTEQTLNGQDSLFYFAKETGGS